MLAKITLLFHYTGSIARGQSKNLLPSSMVKQNPIALIPTNNINNSYDNYYIFYENLSFINN